MDQPIEDAKQSDGLSQELQPIKDQKGKYSLGECIMDNKQVEFIFSRTPGKHKHQRPGKGGGTWDYVTGVYVKKVLNYLSGWLWDFEIVDRGNVQVGTKIIQVWVQGRLTLKRLNPITNQIETTIVKTQFGGADVKYMKSNQNQPLDYANDLKAAATDALKKCASELGIASDVYGKNEFREIKEVAPIVTSKPTAQPKKQPEKPQPNQTDYLGKLKAELHKRGATTEKEAVDLVNRVTGLSIKSLRVSQATAQNLLFQFLNSPSSKQ